MQWFQIKEQSAGEKRLILTWHLYKIFGKRILYFIAFLVSFFTFIFAPKIRSYSKKYFSVINIKPSLINQFIHIYQYASSLADKMLMYCNDYDIKDVVFDDKEDKEQLMRDMLNKKGVFLICNHIGNIEIIQMYAYKYIQEFNFYINMFVSKKQSNIFNNFLKTIKKELPVKFFYVEEIGINTGAELKENLDKGDIVFIAGDRLAQDNDTKSIEAKMFNNEILLPKGAFKLAKLMNVPTYFISAIKYKGKYKVITQKQDDLSQKALSESFVKFMEKGIEINPYQFFNFYDFFNTEKI